MLYYVPQYFQVVAKQDAVQSSLSLMPVVVTSIALSWLTGLLTTLIGRYKWSLVIGSALQLVGTVLLYTMFKPGAEDGATIAVMIVVGFAFGCQMQSSIVGCQSATHQRMVAIATSVRNFSRNIGGVLGIAMSGIIIHIRFPSYMRTELNGIMEADEMGQVQHDPLSIHHMGEKLGPHVDKVVELYSRALGETYLVYIPLSALVFLVTIVLHEYSLQRTAEGEPVRIPGLHTVLLKRIRAKVGKADVSQA